MTATADQLVKVINDRCKEIHSLSTTVDFQLTEGGPRKGKEQTFTSLSGYILQRKPGSLRVAGYLPVVALPAFDMATNGESFKLWIPSRNKMRGQRDEKVNGEFGQCVRGGAYRPMIW